MSMAPANRASIAAGPALKVFHSTLALDPRAWSKARFALPTIAWACVIFGNAPTRTVTCDCTSGAAKDNRRPITKAASCEIRTMISVGFRCPTPPWEGLGLVAFVFFCGFACLFQRDEDLSRYRQGLCFRGSWPQRLEHRGRPCRALDGRGLCQ